MALVGSERGGRAEKSLAEAKWHSRSPGAPCTHLRPRLRLASWCIARINGRFRVKAEKGARGYFLAGFRPLMKKAALAFITVLLFMASHSATGFASPLVLLTPDSESRTAAPVRNLRAAAAGQLTELGINVLEVPQLPSVPNVRLARQVSKELGPIAVVWLERASRGLTLYFYEPVGPRLYARRLEEFETPAATEALAIMLRSAVVALREGGAVAMPELPLPEPAPEPKQAIPTAPAPSGTPRRSTLGAAAGYAGSWYARKTAVQHGLALSSQLRPGQGPWFLGVSYTHFAALDIEQQGVLTRLRRHAAEAFLGAELRVAPFWFVAQGAFVGDLVHRTTASAAAPFVGTSPSQRWSWALSTRLGCALPLSSAWDVYVNVGADFLLSRFEHVVIGAEGSAEAVVSPLPTRPRMELGLRWWLL
jgi:hypothetical protein